MQTSDTEPRRATNGDETDAYSRFGRLYLACLQRAGVRTKTKRRTRRRERRERRADARRQRWEG